MPSSKRTLASLSSTIRILALRMSLSLSIGEFQRDVERVHKLLDLDRLRKIPKESGLQAFLDVSRHCVGAESYDRDVGCSLVLTKNLQGFDAADPGQIDIHQDDFRTIGSRKLDAQIPVRRTQQAHIRAPREELLDQFQVGGVILHIEQCAQRRVIVHPLRYD